MFADAASGVGAPSAAMRRDPREVLYLIAEAVVIISAIASAVIVAALAFSFRDATAAATVNSHFVRQPAHTPPTGATAGAATV